MLFRLTRFAEALEAYDFGLQLAPDNAIGHVNRGTALLELGRPEDARACCARALALDPGLCEAHSLHGTVLVALRRLPEAVLAFERALATGRAAPGLLLSLGNTLRTLRDPVRAREAYLRATASPGSAAAAWFNLGNIERDAARYEAAAERYDRAYAIDPDLDYLVGTRLFNAMTIPRCISRRRDPGRENGRPWTRARPPPGPGAGYASAMSRATFRNMLWRS
jgi:tetratricopeptide (TPR) repeat protein